MVALPVKSKDKSPSPSSRASLFSTLRMSAASVPPQRRILSSIRGRCGGDATIPVEPTHRVLRRSISYPGRHPSLTNRASQSFWCSGQWESSQLTLQYFTCCQQYTRGVGVGVPDSQQATAADTRKYSDFFTSLEVGATELAF